MRTTSVLLVLVVVMSGGCGDAAVDFWVADYLPVEESRVGTEVIIPTTENTAFLLDAGWQPLDAADAASGLWVYGRRADFRFWAATVDDLVLEMEARQFAHPEAPAQVVEISANGSPVDLKRILPRWERIELPLPRETLRYGWNRVVLEFRHATSPHEYDPASGDRRHLAARFRWLRIRAGSERTPWPRSPGTISLERPEGGGPRLDMPTDSMIEATLIPGPEGRLVGSLDVSVAAPGITAAVEIVDRGGDRHLLYETAFDDAPWWREEIDLSLAEWAGEPVVVRLASRGPGRGVVRWYDAGFSGIEDSPFTGDPPARAAAPPSSGRFAGHDVVLILVDTLRADTVLVPGTHPPTPNIDGLAREGTRFLQAWAPSSWTGQTLPALLSGNYPDAIGAEAWGSPFPDAVPSMPELFAAGGYFTSLWSQHNVYRTTPALRRGFEAFDDVPSVPAHRERLADPSQLLDDERPSFAFVHLIPPHQPYEPPEPFRGSLTEDGEPFDVAGLTLRIRAEQGKVTPDFLRYARGRYDENVVFADHLVGRLLESLRQSGAYEDATIVVLSDHGEAFFEHGLFLHSEQVYEESLHVPLIVKWPASATGFAATVDDPVSLVDVLPTLVDAAGLGGGQLRTQGRSLLSPALDDVELHRDVYAYTRGRTRAETDPRPVYALRSGRYKLVHDPLAGTYEVYDLEADPGETSDLSSSLPARTALLTDKLLLTRHQNSLHRALVTEGVEAPELDAEALRQLRALGYVR